jgi:hypothetical protein
VPLHVFEPPGCPEGFVTHAGYRTRTPSTAPPPRDHLRRAGLLA